MSFSFWNGNQLLIKKIVKEKSQGGWKDFTFLFSEMTLS